MARTVTLWSWVAVRLRFDGTSRRFYNRALSHATPTPHDAFFRQLFTDQEVARDFVQHYLPADITNLLDLNTLQTLQESNVDPDLQSHYADILYQVQLADGQTAYLYLLFEHKSYPDPQVSFQLLRYLVRIWEQDLKAEGELRPILPIIFYHGANRWQIATDFQALMPVPPVLSRYVPQFHYWLYDLSCYSEADIQGQVALRVSLLVLKYLQSEEPDEGFVGLVDLMVELSGQQRGLEQLYTLLRYVGHSSETLKTETFIRVVEALAEHGGTEMPTIAERLIEQGREQGLEQGREATLTTLRRLLAYRFDISPDQLEADLTNLTLAQLTKLTDVAFTVDTLAEFQTHLTPLTSNPPPNQD